MKKIQLIFKLAVTGISTNKVRSFLTTLGIVIGIASVIAMLSLGTGAQNDILGEVSKLGTNVATVLAGSGDQGPGAGTEKLTIRDYNFINDNKRFPYISAISPRVNGTLPIRYQSQKTSINVYGVNELEQSMQSIELEKGSFIKKRDVENVRNVAVVGYKVVEELFNNPREVSSILGKKVIINGINFEIIGIIKEADASSFDDPNAYVYIPHTTASERIFETDEFTTIRFMVDEVDLMNFVVIQVEEDLAEFRGVTEPDFSIFTSEDLIGTITQITDIFTWLLAGIAGISLLVGGIGISNIMLVSVTERTKEIGLRKAIGAKQSDIMLQFLVESVFLTLLGGVIGIILGILLGVGISSLAGITPAITLSNIFLATLVSTVIGIVFGYFPAYKAARLNPIDALRYE